MFSARAVTIAVLSILICEGFLVYSFYVFLQMWTCNQTQIFNQSHGGPSKEGLMVDQRGFKHITAPSSPNTASGSGRCDELSGHLKNMHAVFTGMTMNDAGHLPRMIEIVESLGSCFADYDVVVIENDSTDRTKEILKEWQRSNPRVIVETRNFQKRKRPSISWLAKLRNRALEIAFQHSYASKVRHEWSADLLVNFDMDLAGVDIKGFAGAARLIAGGMVAASANGVWDNARYYDMFAFRSCNLHWDATKGTLYKIRQISKAMMVYTADLPPFPVDSAFSGAAVYNATAVFGPIPPDHPVQWTGEASTRAATTYATVKGPRGHTWTYFSGSVNQGALNQGPCTYSDGGIGECEHVPFHACLNARAKELALLPLHVVPSFGVLYGHQDKFPGPYVLPVPNKNNFLSVLKVPIPSSKLGQPQYWKGPSPIQCDCQLLGWNEC